MKDKFLGFIVCIFFIVPILGYTYLALFNRPIPFCYLVSIATFWFFVLTVRTKQLPDIVGLEISLVDKWIVVAGVQFVGLPLIMSFFGVSDFRLQREIASKNLSFAVYLQCLMLIAAALGFRFFSRMNPRKSRTLSGLNYGGLQKKLLIYGIIGCSCLIFLKITNWNDRLGIYSSDSNFILKFLAISLSPLVFYSFGVWSWRLKGENGDRGSSIVRVVFVGSLSIAPLLLFNFNRASLAVPLIAYLLIRFPVSMHLSKVLSWALIFSLTFILVNWLGEYRAQQNVTENRRYSLESAGYTANPGWSETLQLYTNAPQYLGYGLEYIDRTRFSLLTPFYSFVEPLPKLSKLNSQGLDGTSLFNYAVYENIKIRDLYFSTVGETYLAWGFIGAFLCFFLIGGVISRLNNVFCMSRNYFARFLALVSGLWFFVFPMVSISVVSQILFYSVLPGYIILRSNRKEVA
jgi:hypothetical protein